MTYPATYGVTYGVAEPGAPVGAGAVVHLGALWLNDAADLADALAVPMEVDSRRTWSVPGEVREYAGGRRRAVRRIGETRSWAPKLAPMPQDVGEALVARRGRTQWVRDPLGGRVAAVFYDADMVLAGILDSGTGPVQHVAVSLVLTTTTHLLPG